MQVTKPLFNIDAGWLYIAAGLALCAAAILVPVQQDLRDLRRQLENIKDKEHLVSLQLRHSAALLDELDAGNAALIRRLAASQLNLVPAEHTPLLRSLAPTQTVTEWVNNSIRYERVDRPPHSPTMLENLTGGTGRLWLFGAGSFCVFFGLLADPALGAISRLRALRLTRRRIKPTLTEAVAIEMTRAAGALAAALPPRAEPATEGVDADGEGDRAWARQLVTEEDWRSLDAVASNDLTFIGDAMGLESSIEPEPLEPPESPESPESPERREVIIDVEPEPSHDDGPGDTEANAAPDVDLSPPEPALTGLDEPIGSLFAAADIALEEIQDHAASGQSDAYPVSGAVAMSADVNDVDQPSDEPVPRVADEVGDMTAAAGHAANIDARASGPAPEADFSPSPMCERGDADRGDDESWEYLEVGHGEPLPAEDDDYEYEYVYVDDEGRELVEEPPQPPEPAKPGRSRQRKKAAKSRSAGPRSRSNRRSKGT